MEIIIENIIARIVAVREGDPEASGTQWPIYFVS